MSIIEVAKNNILNLMLFLKIKQRDGGELIENMLSMKKFGRDYSWQK